MNYTLIVSTHGLHEALSDTWFLSLIMSARNTVNSQKAHGCCMCGSLQHQHVVGGDLCPMEIAAAANRVMDRNVPRSPAALPQELRAVATEQGLVEAPPQLQVVPRTPDPHNLVVAYTAGNITAERYRIEIGLLLAEATDSSVISQLTGLLNVAPVAQISPLTTTNTAKKGELTLAWKAAKQITLNVARRSEFAKLLDLQGHFLGANAFHMCLSTWTSLVVRC